MRLFSTTWSQWQGLGVATLTVSCLVSIGFGVIYFFGGSSQMLLSEICTKVPVICQNLESGWCKSHRAELIYARWDDLQQPDGFTLMTRIDAVEQYEKCIEKASGIEPKRDHQAKVRRVDSWIDVLEEKRRLYKRLDEHPDEPWILYFRWVKNGDGGALHQLVNQFKQGQIDDPRMLPIMARYFSRSEPKKAIGYLEKSLQFVAPFSPVDHELPQQLANLYHSRGELATSFMWATVANDLSQTPHELAASRLYRRLPDDEKQQQLLLAERVKAQLLLGRFRGLPQSSALEPIERLVAWGKLNRPLKWLSSFHQGHDTATSELHLNYRAPSFRSAEHSPTTEFSQSAASNNR